jgi:hypothetical protein
LVLCALTLADWRELSAAYWLAGALRSVRGGALSLPPPDGRPVVLGLPPGDPWLRLSDFLLFRVLGCRLRPFLLRVPYPFSCKGAV